MARMLRIAGVAAHETPESAIPNNTQLAKTMPTTRRSRRSSLHLLIADVLAIINMQCRDRADLTMAPRVT